MRAKGMLLAWVAAALVTVASAGASPATERPWEPYKILAERNIFARERGRRPARTGPPAVPAPPAPERYVLLRGVVRRDGECVAFLEDMRSGEVIQARAGDAVVRGRLAEVRLDGALYERNEEQTEVAVGDNLERAASRSAGGEPAAAGGHSASEATGAPGDASDILEQLRLKRKRELGQ